jgi:hypothetical protein
MITAWCISYDIYIYVEAVSCYVTRSPLLVEPRRAAVLSTDIVGFVAEGLEKAYIAGMHQI